MIEKLDNRHDTYHGRPQVVVEALLDELIEAREKINELLDAYNSHTHYQYNDKPETSTPVETLNKESKQ